MSTQHLTPVRIGIWDSGVDVALFSDQLSTDSRLTGGGDHGLAFDDQGMPSKSWLHPLTPEQQQAYPQFRELITGLLDLQNGVDSPEADATLKLFATFSVDQIHEMMENNKVLGHYLHGTHVAGILVRGNPAARLVVARFETWLSKTGGGADPAARKQQAAKLFALWRQSIEAAMKSAPGTLFVAAAGNSDSNVKFIEDVPASLHLPNLLVVAAVNQAGDETSFTSHGETVLVDANGYHVHSVVPGGARLKLSGTSMASPNVTNLAGKLFALDPALTPAQAMALIKDGSTRSDDGRRNLIDEKRSVALLHEHYAQ